MEIKTKNRQKWKKEMMSDAINYFSTFIKLQLYDKGISCIQKLELILDSTGEQVNKI